VVIDSPLTGALVNIGDSVLVTLRLHDSKGIRTATLNGVMQKGSVDLGTFQQIQRYKPIAIPSAGQFRYGLHDTTVRRYMQPLNAADTTLDSLIVIATVFDSTNAADTATTDQHRRRADRVRLRTIERRQHSCRRGLCRSSTRSTGRSARARRCQATRRASS
jgi:hypothetical protein